MAKTKAPIKAVKGFRRDMTCRGFQFEEGGKYEQGGKIVACHNGFHACEDPLDVFNYYAPADSVYREVKLSGDIDRDDDDSKVAASRIKIGAEIGLNGVISAGVNFRLKRCSYSHKSVTTGDRAGAQATGDRAGAQATGAQAGAQATGYQAGAQATGRESRVFADGPHAVACALGKDCAAAGTDGAVLLLIERGKFDGIGYPIVGVKTCRVGEDGIKPDVYYRLHNGEIVEAT